MVMGEVRRSRDEFLRRLAEAAIVAAANIRRSSYFMLGSFYRSVSLSVSLSLFVILSFYALHQCGIWPNNKIDFVCLNSSNDSGSECVA